MSADREHSIDSPISLREYVEMLIDHEQELREQMQMKVRRAHDIQREEYSVHGVRLGKGSTCG